MKLNKVLQSENDRLREEVNELRTADMNWHVRWWYLWEENLRLWGLVEGLTCTVPGRKSDKNIHRIVDYPEER